MSSDATLEGRLLDAIRVASGHSRAAWAHAPKRIEGGSWADIFEVQLKRAPTLKGRLVARILPDPASLEREMMIQSHVATSGSLAPAVRLGSPPSSECDRAWFLMDFAPGDIPFGRVTPFAVLKSLLVASRGVPSDLARTMVAIHGIDAAPVAATLAFPRVVGPLLDWLYSRASDLGDGALTDRAQRLIATRPSFAGSVLCHGDLHPLNILRHDGSDLVVDWTHAQYDDPLYDVAFTSFALTVMPVPAPAIVRPLIAAVGRSMARRFVEEYERLSETTVDPARLAWFTQIIALRIRVEAAEWARANPGGDPRSSAAQHYLPFLPRYGF